MVSLQLLSPCVRPFQRSREREREIAVVHSKEQRGSGLDLDAVVLLQTPSRLRL
jgi:hypothetical protein